MDLNMKFKAICILDCNMCFRIFSLSAFLTVIGCASEPAQYQYGFSLSEIEFSYFRQQRRDSPFPDDLSNPNNPFIHGPPAKWDIESAGYPQASFYSWATTLAFEPTGEHQFYTALALHNIYEQELCKEKNAISFTPWPLRPTKLS